MALLFMDGFEAGDLLFKNWTPIAAIAHSTGTDTRFGTGLSYNNTTSWSNGQVVIRKPFTPSQRVIAGWAFKASSVPSQVVPTFSFGSDGGATTQISLRYMNDLSLAVYRGTTQIAVSAPGICNPQVWHYIEMMVECHDTTGLVQVRLNNAEVINFTGDTRDGGTSNLLDSWNLHYTTSPNSRLDDFYICDGTGATHNTFLGDIRVRGLAPTAAGASTLLTASTGSNWNCVDEFPYSATDYVSASVAGYKDLYTVADLPGSPTVLAVQVGVVAKKNDAGPRSVKALLRTYATNYVAATLPLGSSDGGAQGLYVTNPATSAAWTSSDVNAMEIGVEVV